MSEAKVIPKPGKYEYDDKDIKNDISFCNYVVNKFISFKKHLQPFREDMEQEAFIWLMEARHMFNPDLGVPMNTFVYQRVLFSCYLYERKEYRNFRYKSTKKSKGTKGINGNSKESKYSIEEIINNESHLWDIPEPINFEESIDDPKADHHVIEMELEDVLNKAKLTARQREILELYLHYGNSDQEVAKRLGVSRQTVALAIKTIIHKGKGVLG